MRKDALKRHCSLELAEACKQRQGWWTNADFDKAPSKSGYHSQCKVCRRQQARAYKKTHRAAMTNYLRRWQKEHPARTKRLRRAHYLRNIEKEKASTKAWRLANPVLRRAYQRMRYVRFKGHWLTDAEWKEVLTTYGPRCLACGSPNITVDHIKPISKGGTDTKDNVQPLCLSCNSSKKLKQTDFRPDKGACWHSFKR